MNRRLRSAVFLLALQGLTARADEVWVWTDASGETHYTNDVASIPEKSRRAARPLGGDSPLVEPKFSSTTPQETGGPAKPKDEPPKSAEAQPPPPEPIETAVQAPREDEKVSEDQWRSMFRKANDRVRKAERRVQRSREALAKMPGQDVTTYDVAGNIVVESRWQALRVQLDEEQAQLDEAREQLHDLERAAAREAVPLEWRR
jgi:hypothetical protein